MTRSRLVLSAGLLALLPMGLSGCGQGDGGEYRPYSDPLDGAPGIATPAPRPATETTPPTHDPSLRPPAGAGIEVAAVPAETLDTAPIAVPLAPDLPPADANPTESTGPAGDSLANAAVTPGAPAANGAGAAGANPAVPREIKLLVPEKSFRTVGPEGALQVSYDDLDLLKVLNMEPVTVDAPDHFPQWLTDLEGQRIRLRGYMRPTFVAEGIEFFVLARDTNACCFGPNTKAYDIIPVKMRAGVTTDYIELRPFDLVGVFHIVVNPDFADESKVETLYYIDDAIIIRK